MNKLFLIPARGGSKGLHGKNIKLLSGRPLIHYTLDAVAPFLKTDTVCVSTDSVDIKNVVEDYGVKVPFMRPASLASDTATTEAVVLHALDYYRKFNVYFEHVVIMQPTSPLRTYRHVEEALARVTSGTQMVVSVKESKANPYFTLFEEDNQGFLRKSKERNFDRRQDCPKVYEYNGAVYIIAVNALVTHGLAGLSSIVKYVMDKEESIDIDDELDWSICEILMSRRL
jgi:CMP-N,N'-diacetyllegionaminic acid synthase